MKTETKASAVNKLWDVILCAALIIAPLIIFLNYADDLTKVPLLEKVIIGILAAALGLRLICVYDNEDSDTGLSVASLVLVLSNIVLLICLHP